MRLINILFANFVVTFAFGVLGEERKTTMSTFLHPREPQTCAEILSKISILCIFYLCTNETGGHLESFDVFAAEVRAVPMVARYRRSKVQNPGWMTRISRSCNLQRQP